MVDVETANPDLESICQIGIVSIDDSVVQGQWQSLVNPEDYFDEFNIYIHGIDETAVDGAPTFSELYSTVASLLTRTIVVSHTHFDRVSLHRACERYGLSPIECEWLDSARVVRCAWPDRYARSGYSLSNVALDLGIEYRAHDALEDARAASQVLLHAINETGLGLAEWLIRVQRPITSATIYDTNPDGPLFGEVACFTGALTIPRREAASLAAAAGCVVSNGVTKNTTLLVVGQQDFRKLAGHTLSSKHRKAEQLISEGSALRIVGEADFRRIASIDTGSEPISV